MKMSNKKGTKKNNLIFLRFVIYLGCSLQCSMFLSKWLIHHNISFKFDFIIRNAARNHVSNTQWIFIRHSCFFFLFSLSLLLGFNKKIYSNLKFFNMFSDLWKKKQQKRKRKKTNRKRKWEMYDARTALFTLTRWPNV